MAIQLASPLRGNWLINDNTGVSTPINRDHGTFNMDACFCWSASVSSHKSTAASPQTKRAGTIGAVGELGAPQAAEDAMLQDHSSEAIVPRVVPDVIAPTKLEREQHETTHLPFLSWCEHCVKGKSTERYFTTTGHQSCCAPCFHSDYIFMGEETTTGTTPILVLKDDKQESVCANVVPEKGANEFTVKQTVEDIDLTGFADIVF
jgi:hypothetical protein